MEYTPCEDPECYGFWPEDEGDADYIRQLECDRDMEAYFLRDQEEAFNNYSGVAGL